jgi:hypothetical protein
MRDVFSPLDELRMGWRTTLASLKTWVVFGVVVLFLGIVENALGRGHSILLALSVQALQIAVGLAAVRVALRLADGEPAGELEPKTLLVGYFSFLLTQMLLGLIVTGGLILLIVPGVIWGLMFGFAPFLCAAHRLDPIESFRESRRITAGHRKTLLIFWLLCLAANFVGALAFGIGLFVTVPTTLIAASRVMRRLEAEAPHIEIQHPITTAHA